MECSNFKAQKNVQQNKFHLAETGNIIYFIGAVMLLLIVLYLNVSDIFLEGDLGQLYII